MAKAILFCVLTAVAVSSVAGLSTRAPADFIPSEEIRLPDLGTLPSAPPGYKSVPVRWFGQASKNGPNITIVGNSLEQIAGKLREINPDFDRWNSEALAKQPKLSPGRNVNDTAAIQARADYDYHILCDRPNFTDGDAWRFSQGANYLFAIAGWCVVDGGKGSCNRCSCSYGSALWMCNDSNYGITHQYMYCSDMGEYVYQMLDVCSCTQAQGWKNCDGQKFRHDTEYSVLMAGGGGC